MSKAKKSGTLEVGREGERKPIGAKRVGEKVQVTREVLRREGDKTVVRFKTSSHSRPKVKAGKPGRSEWMQNPELPDRLLKAFRTAVERAVPASEK